MLALLAIITLSAWTLPNLASGRCALSFSRAVACHEQSGEACSTTLPAASLYACLKLSQSDSLDSSRDVQEREREARLLAGGMTTAPLKTRKASSADSARLITVPGTDRDYGPPVTSQTPQSAWSGFMTPLLA